MKTFIRITDAANKTWDVDPVYISAIVESPQSVVVYLGSSQHFVQMNPDAMLVTKFRKDLARYATDQVRPESKG